MMDSGLLEMDSGSLDSSYSAEQVSYLEEKKQNKFRFKKYSRVSGYDVQPSSMPLTNPFMQPQQFNNFQQQFPNNQYSNQQPQQSFLYPQQNQSFDLFAPSNQTNNNQQTNSFLFEDYSMRSIPSKPLVQVSKKENVDSNKVQHRYFKNGGNNGESLIDFDFVAGNI